MMQVLSIVQAIIGIIGLPIAIFSVLLLASQTRNLERSIRSQVYQGIIQYALKIDELFLQYPELRKYLYGNELIDENTPDFDRIMAAVEFVIDVMDHLNVQRKYIPSDLRPSWDKFLYDILDTPAAKYFLAKHPDWYIVLRNVHQTRDVHKK